MKIKTIIHNLTLIELLISLGILAAIASVALSMLEESSSQQRFERTWETGKSIREVINAGKTDDGISRFVSDMGRLPVVISIDDGMRLGEFYYADGVDSNVKWSSSVTFTNNTSSLPAADSSLDFPSDFTSLKQPCGWGGPYFYNYKTTLYDGWNNEWQILDSSYNRIESLAIGNFIYGIESRGSDNGDDEDTWSSKSQMFKFNTSGTARADQSSLIVTIMVQDNSTLNSTIKPVIKYEASSASNWARQ